MSHKVRVNPELGVLAPRACVACGAPAELSPYETKATGSDLQGKHYVTFTFPLCDACGAAQQEVRHTMFWRRKRLPAEQRERAAQANHAVVVAGLKYPVFGKPSVTIKFANDTYALLFENANSHALAA